MEVQCYSGANFGRQSFPARPLDEPRTLKWSWLETQYRRLKLRYKASVGIIAGLRVQLAATERKMWEGEMNGECIMACREFIEAKLGVNAVRIPGLNINSPFFDDLIYGIVGSLISETSRADKAQKLADSLANSMLPAPNTALSQYAMQQLMHQQAQAAAQAQTATAMTVANTFYYSGAGTTNTVLTGLPSNGTFSTGTLVSTGTTYAGMVGSVITSDDMAAFGSGIKLLAGQQSKVTLPDGTIIDVAKDGSFSINDADAKVVYRANRVREFNRFINASDILSKFIEFCGKESTVTRDEMLELPVNLFIQYLILEAAKADGEPEPSDLTLLPDLRKVVNCLGCDQPLPPERRVRKLHYCGPSCLEKHERRELEIAA